MSTTTDFIAELIRAANEVHLLAPLERKRLVDRAAATIAAQRELLEFRDKVVPLSHGVVSDLENMRRHTAEGPDVVVASVLSLCAEEIRRLRILAGE
jgi:hypothetical protein